MRSRGVRVLQWLAWTALFGAVLAGCGGGGSPPAISIPPPATAPPSIQTQPQDVTVDDGATASFSVTVVAEGTPSYQWKKNGTDIAGANGTSFTTPALGLADSGSKFSVSVTNAGGTVVSGSALLTVRPVAPVFDVQPVSGAVKVGSSFAWSAHATGSQPLNYQWFRGGLAIPGATSGNLQLDAAAFADDGVPYTVQASNPAGAVLSTEVRLSIAPAVAPTVISTCREITAPGSYVLDRDIVGPEQVFDFCLSIHDTRDVQLDCARHALSYTVSEIGSLLRVSNVKNFSIKNCVLDGWLNEFEGSSDGAVTGNSFAYTRQYFQSYADPYQNKNFPTMVKIFISRSVVLDRNALDGGGVQLVQSTAITVSNNAFVGGERSLSGSITSRNGAHNRILNNTMSGGWNGQAATGLYGTRVGADDGIIIHDEDDIRVEDNLIQNYWDTGIESLGFIRNSTVKGNRIVRCEFSGIGGWYYTSLLNNVFARNTVEKSGNLFQFMRVFGLRQANTDGANLLDTAVYFKDNVFEGNTLLDPVPRSGTRSWAAEMAVYDRLGYGGGVGGSPGEVELKPADFVLSNNVFRNNDFSAQQAYAPYFGSGPVLPGVIVDGGGNKCQLQVADKTYPLACQ